MSLVDTTTTELPIARAIAATAATANGEFFIVVFVKLFLRFFQNDCEIVSIDLVEEPYDTLVVNRARLRLLRATDMFSYRQSPIFSVYTDVPALYRVIWDARQALK
jgi:hypothetical protein